MGMSLRIPGNWRRRTPEKHFIPGSLDRRMQPDRIVGHFELFFGNFRSAVAGLFAYHEDGVI
jgi:hypothetical protein